MAEAAKLCDRHEWYGTSLGACPDCEVESLRAALRKAEAQRDAEATCKRHGWWSTVGDDTCPDCDAERGRAEALAGAAQMAIDHVLELEEAWARGVLDEYDGRGGERSNRNVEVRVALRRALAGEPLPDGRWFFCDNCKPLFEEPREGWPCMNCALVATMAEPERERAQEASSG